VVLWLGIASRRTVVKALRSISLESPCEDRDEAHLRLGTWCTREGIESNMHLTTRPQIRHMLTSEWQQGRRWWSRNRVENKENSNCLRALCRRRLHSKGPKKCTCVNRASQQFPHPAKPTPTPETHALPACLLLLPPPLVSNPHCTPESSLR
jgi:hypothetical protein